MGTPGPGEPSVVRPALAAIGASAAVGRPIGIADTLRDAAPLGDLVAVLGRPLANQPVLIATARRAARATRRTPAGAAGTAPADARARLDERVQYLTQLAGIGLGKVDG